MRGREEKEGQNGETVEQGGNGEGTREEGQGKEWQGEWTERESTPSTLPFPPKPEWPSCDSVEGMVARIHVSPLHASHLDVQQGHKAECRHKY